MSTKEFGKQAEPSKTQALDRFLILCLVLFSAFNIFLMVPSEFLNQAFLPAYTYEFIQHSLSSIEMPFFFNSMMHWSSSALLLFGFCSLFSVLFLFRAGAVVKHLSDCRERVKALNLVAALGFLPISVLTFAASFILWHRWQGYADWLHRFYLNGNLSFSGLVESGGASWAFDLVILIFVFMYLYRFLCPEFDFQVTDQGLLISAQNRFLAPIFGNRLVIWSEIKSARINTRAGKSETVGVELNDGAKYSFSVDSIRKFRPVAEFMLLLKNRSGVEFDYATEEKNSATAGDYTELWLRYFSSPEKRTRKSSLCKGDEVGGRFSIISTLGQGGQGTAYLAQSMSAEQSSGSACEALVLKEYILPFHRGESVFRDSLNKLQKEAAILSRIRHPNIVQCRECFVDDHRGYLVLEYLEGEGLNDYVARNGALSEPQVIEIILQICNAVEYMHTLDQRIIHRDLTPDNCILQETGCVKIVDFNVAHQLESSATNTVVGKHAYIPPEQFRGKATEQSDIYAIGGTMHFLLTGANPEPMSVSSPHSIKSSVSEELDAIVRKATALEAKDRYSTAFELRAALFDLARKNAYYLSEHVEPAKFATDAPAQLIDVSFDSQTIQLETSSEELIEIGSKQNPGAVESIAVREPLEEK